MQCEFRTVSRHRSSAGWVRYQRCRCGLFRVLVGDVVLGRAAR